MAQRYPKPKSELMVFPWKSHDAMPEFCLPKWPFALQLFQSGQHRLAPRRTILAFKKPYRSLRIHEFENLLCVSSLHNLFKLLNSLLNTAPPREPTGTENKTLEPTADNLFCPIMYK
ncbi:hypothetical protein [Shimia sp. MIT1388]|uniref:hypothetical protein n=1 Tax=Shimia sp. MIT1388 TaxID=3096992 RepID=UPI00399AC455